MPLINEFVAQINIDPSFDGDVLEFGTGSGRSTSRIASMFKNGKIHTFDGFVGLPKTNKVIPMGTDWYEGNLKFDEKETRDRLKPFKNVTVHKCMTFDLKEPNHYNINKISGVNIDVDLYEGTLDSLNFMDKCDWKCVLVRFDDWGFYRGTTQIESEVAEHEKAAFYDFINEKKYDFIFYEKLNNFVDNRQVLVKISR